VKRSRVELKPLPGSIWGEFQVGGHRETATLGRRRLSRAARIEHSTPVIDADPTPFWIAVPGLLALSLILLVYSGLSARLTEISYGE
jgi:hypothetical protein